MAKPRKKKSSTKRRPSTAKARVKATPELKRELLDQLMFGTGRVRRFTQDSPVLPDVWLEYAGVAGDRDEWADSAGYDPGRKKLLITPWKDRTAGDVRRVLVERLPDDEVEPTRVAYNQTTVAARLRFEDLVRIVLPMTEWWARVERELPLGSLQFDPFKAPLVAAVQDPEHAPHVELPKPTAVNTPPTDARPVPEGDVLVYRFPPALLWTMRVVGTLQLVNEGKGLPRGFLGERGVAGAGSRDWKRVVDAFLRLIEGAETGPAQARIYAISRNRLATPAVVMSSLAIKADAARRLFNISCAHLTWAIIDSGIDATHPAFHDRSAQARIPPDKEFSSRVVRTYNFIEIDKLLDPHRTDEATSLKKRLEEEAGDDMPSLVADLKAALESGRALDWKLLEPMLRVPHEEEKYVAPRIDHGTHVAGILGADWRISEAGGLLEKDMEGVCPDIRLYDLRVFDENGRGEEFGVMAALQFVRWLNSTNDYTVVHGVNLSLSLRHEVANYACGRTPVCDECERLVSSGVIVVAAAGNQGHRRYTTEQGVTTEAYNSISITDPGNADQVITVGATHRYRPHTYGVSYFSSRGPTGDGRKKPDLVAPGEKITAPLPNGSLGSKDGTSMAAPHVSGAAALLLARHNELIGEPERVKQILCGTATDLGRERYFQGAGMIDILRAIQSV